VSTRKTYATAVDYEAGDADPIADAFADDRYEPPPIDVLPVPAAAMVRETAAAMSVDPAYAMMPALFAMSVAVGNTVRAIVKTGWTEPMIVWAALSARSGTNKTAPARLLIGPLRRLNSRLIREYEEAAEGYERAMLAHERAVAEWKKSKTAELCEPPEAPEPPPMRRVLIDDATIERLAPIQRDNPRGVGVYRDELNAWIGSMDRYASSGGGELGKWLPMHTGEPLIVDRGGTSGRGVVVHVPNAGTSLYGTIQPGVLRRSMTGERTSAGLFARLLIASPPWRPKRSTDAEITPATLKAWDDLLGTLGNTEMATDDEGEPTPHHMGMARPARQAFDAWADVHNATAEGESDSVAAAVGKLEAYAVRFALLFALCEGAGQIDVGHVERGTRLADWFRREAIRVYAMADEGEGDARQRDLLEWVNRRPDGATARDLATSGPRRLRGKPKESDAELRELAEAGYGTYEYPAAGPGRPSRHFVPAPSRGSGIKTLHGNKDTKGFDSASEA
jgi:hypothetical protein